MKIIILEGIATSGKTSVKNELEKILDQRQLAHVFIGEEKTLMPVLHEKDAMVVSKHALSLFDEYTKERVDVLIFDRFYLTYIWRTKASIESFELLSNKLKEHNVILCLLTISENLISERIENAMMHRDKAWNEYVLTRGETAEKRFEYYAKQQRELLEIAKALPVEVRTFSSDSMNFAEIAENISQTT